MEQTIKKIMLAKYPNGEQFYINNKKEFEQIWKSAERKIIDSLNDCIEGDVINYDKMCDIIATKTIELRGFKSLL